MVLRFVRFLLSVGTCLAFIPGIQLIYKRKRHFELYIALFQLLSSIIYSGLDALQWSTFSYVPRDEWHRMSDILTETYICLLGLHLMGIKKEDFLHSLRYIAFTGCWIAKYGDGWSSIYLEAGFLALYIIPPFILFLNYLSKKIPDGSNIHLNTNTSINTSGSGSVRSGSGNYDNNNNNNNSSNIFDVLDPILPGKGNGKFRSFFSRRYTYEMKVFPETVLFLSLGLLFLVLELSFDTEYRLFNALAHVAFGGSSYFLWQLLPCYDKGEDLPLFK